jgi:hypothetical protein
MADEKPIADPKRITDKYERQYARPGDRLDEQERAERLAELEEARAAGPQPHPAMVEFQEQEANWLGEHAETQAPSGDIVDAAVQAHEEAAKARVEEAQLTGYQLQARALVDEMENRGVVLGDRHFHTDDDEPDRDAELEAFLEQPDEDRVVGTDAAGNTVFEDANGVQYILTAEG